MSVYFENGKRYRVPTNVRSRSHQLSSGLQIQTSLAQLGITTAVHFGSFASGEMLYGKDKDGRDVSFLVDSSHGFELVDESSGGT